MSLVDQLGLRWVTVERVGKGVFGVLTERAVEGIERVTRV